MNTDKITDQQFAEITAKIQKLSKLAANDSGAFEGEAANATAAIQKMLLEYNLTMSDVESATEDGPKTAVGQEDFVFKGDRSDRFIRWQSDLLAAVAEANYCRVYGWGYKKVQIIGRPYNVTVTKSLWAWLITEVRRLQKNAVKAQPWDTVQMFDHRKRCFRDGVVVTIDQRLRQQRDAVAANVGNAGTALVINLKAEVDAYIDEVSGNKAYKERQAKADAELAAKRAADLVWAAEQDRLAAERAERQKIEDEAYWAKENKRAANRKGRAGVPFDHNAYAAGRAAGKTINLNQQITKSDNAKLK